MLVDFLSAAGSYSTRLLQPPDIAALQQLFDRASDYFEITTGAKPGPDEAQRAFVAGPPGKSVTDKRTVGVFDGEGRMVGVIDSITDWPAEGTWTVGMLLLDPDLRGQGLGGELHAAFAEWARSQGARRFRTALADGYEQGARFVNRMGYRALQRFEYNAGARKVAAVFYELEIGPAGFEPALPDPKSGVLPLDEGPDAR